MHILFTAYFRNAQEPVPLPSQRVNWLVTPPQLLKVPAASPIDLKPELAAEGDNERNSAEPELKTSSSQAKIWWSHTKKDPWSVAERVEDLQCTHDETPEVQQSCGHIGAILAAPLTWLWAYLRLQQIPTLHSESPALLHVVPDVNLLPYRKEFLPISLEIT